MMEILADCNAVLPLLRSQEIARAHASVVTETRVTQVLIMIKQQNLESLLAKVIACTCYMHITMQCFFSAQL